MPITGVNLMISVSDNHLPPPLKYPGLYSHRNRKGTIKSKPEWLMDEVKKWVEFMHKNDKYDHSYHSVKSKVLCPWLKKTFSKISINICKDMLYAAESEMDDIDTAVNNDSMKNVRAGRHLYTF